MHLCFVITLYLAGSVLNILAILDEEVDVWDPVQDEGFTQVELQQQVLTNTGEAERRIHTKVQIIDKYVL